MVYELVVTGAAIGVLFLATRLALGKLSPWNVHYRARQRRALPLVDKITELGKLLNEAPRNLPADIRQNANQVMGYAQAAKQLDVNSIGHAEDIGDVIGGYYGILEYHCRYIRQWSATQTGTAIVPWTKHRGS